MKLKLPVLHSIAVGEGFKGSADDGPGMKKFLTDLDVSIADDSGKSVKAADIDIDDGKGKTINLPKSEPKADDSKNIPADLDKYIAARVEAESKKFALVGAAGSDRPKVGDATVVKSGVQRKWEADKERGEKFFRDFDTAKAYTLSLLAQTALVRNQPAEYQKSMEAYRQICETKGYTTTSQAAGGALVPEQFEPDVINLVKDYGVARRLCKVIRMESDRVVRPRVTGTHTVYYPAEASAITQSTQTWSNATLTAKTGHVLVRMSLQVLDDAAIDLVEHATREAARAIARVEDFSLFHGAMNVSSAYGSLTAETAIPGVQGIVNTFGTTATEDSRSTIMGDTADAHTLADVTTCMGLLPGYARSKAVFTCSPEIMTMVLFRLAQAQGGVTFREFVDMGPQPMALGYPVITNNVMQNQNASSAAPLSTADTPDILFGDFTLGVMFGDRGGVQAAISNERYFDTYEVGLRVSVRHDINVHDLGSTTTSSPIVAGFQT